MTNQYSYGGQALIEGVMMRGQREMAVAVRNPAGEILLWSAPVTSSWLGRRVRPWPCVRGAFLLWDTMCLGVRALTFSAAIGTPPVERRSARARSAEGGLLDRAPAWVLVALAVSCALALFFALPLAVVAALDCHIDSSIESNALEGAIRLAVLIGYVLAIGHLPEVQRVFAYHGAEHKAIHAYEAGDPLDVAHVRRHPLAHPRCGTGFLLTVIVLSTAACILLGRPDMPERIVSRLVLAPIVAGLAYELLKLAARRPDHPLARVVLAPGLWLQKLTTREPDDEMIEVAIAALVPVLEADGHAANAPAVSSPVRQVDATGRALIPASTAAS